MLRAIDVADYILGKLAQGRELETAKLQKLLYFCQGWSYALLDAPLFEDKFEAWRYGPVIRSIYGPFAKSIQIPSGERFGGNPEALSLDQRRIVDAVIRDYGGLGTFALIELTHMEGTPWSKVHVVDGPPVEIDDEEIRRYFKAEYNRVRETRTLIA